MTSRSVERREAALDDAQCKGVVACDLHVCSVPSFRGRSLAQGAVLRYNARLPEPIPAVSKRGRVVRTLLVSAPTSYAPEATAGRKLGIYRRKAFVCSLSPGLSRKASLCKFVRSGRILPLKA